MKEPNQDDERLSELLDGRVQGPQRGELLAHVSANDYAVFADTASLLRALEEEDERTAAATPEEEEALVGAVEHEGVIPLRPAARERRMPPRWLAAAASIAAVALTLTFTLRTGGSHSVEPVQLAARVNAGGLPRGWAARSPWPAARGGRTAQDAVRTGARLVELAVAAQVGDTALTHRLALGLSNEHEPSTSPVRPLRRIADHPAIAHDSIAMLIDQAWERLPLDREPLELGAWVEAARLAAKGRNDEFFRGRTTRGMLRRARRFADDEAAVDRVFAALRTSGPRNWVALEASLSALAVAIAS